MFFAALSTVAGGLYYLSREPLPEPAPLKQTTLIYDASGRVIGTFSEENRIDVTLKQVPQVVIDAVISTEDRHFFTEGALNPVSVLRAMIDDLRGSGNLQGGSTITQQYVKQTYLNSERTFSRKLKEAALSIRLAQAESKDTILQDYLNTIYWGRGAYGVDAASEAYFGKDVGKLGLREASLLAGLIRQPATADPAVNPAQARLNQADTLRAMERDHKITDAQAAAVEATPFSKYVISPHAGTGFVTSVPGDQYFISAVQQQLYDKYGTAVVDGGGLRVTTTLNPTLQAEAYNAVYGPSSPGSLNPAGGDPSGALVSVDDTGAVRALVGGQNYATSNVDLALGSQGGGSGRQAGSTFKAIMLAYLISQGYSVESMFPAPAEVVIPHGNQDGTDWSIKNFEGDNPPPQISLVQATADSINTVYAQVVARLGAAHLVSMAESLGISAADLDAGGCPCPSEVLGTADVSPLEMAAAFSAFANGGVYHQPYLIAKVTTSTGRSLPLPVARKGKTVLTPDQAALESYVLQQVVLDGTGTEAGGIGTPVAGKTGTTQNAADAWFVGYTPTLSTAVWMGYAAGGIPMQTCTGPPGPTQKCVGFRGIPNGVQGGTIPAELWHNYMAAALASFPQYGGSFPAPLSFGTTTLTPPGPGQVVIPTTTTTPTTTIPTATTTAPQSSTTTTTTPSRPSTTTTVAHTTTTK